MKDLFTKQVKNVYSKTHEHTFQTDYQFMSEDDMRAAGWSEIPFCNSQPCIPWPILCLSRIFICHGLRKKMAGVKRHCASIPGYTRQDARANNLG